MPLYARLPPYGILTNSPSVSGRLVSSSLFFLSIAVSELSVALSRPSSGFPASDEIIQLRPSRVAPETFPYAHNMRTRLSEIPHFSAACFTVIYIKETPLFSKHYILSKESYQFERNNIFHFSEQKEVLNITCHFRFCFLLIASNFM